MKLLPSRLAITCVALACFFGEALGEEEPDEEDEEEISYFVVSATIMVILTAMVAFSVLFEQGRERLEEATPASLQPVLRSLFAELTLLGFIGLSLFLLDKLEAVHVLSEDLFGEEDAIGETSESVHMALFSVMVIFLGTVLHLISLGSQVSLKWQRWEENILDTKLIHENVRELTKRPMSCFGYFHNGEHEEFQVLVYSALRRGLIDRAAVDPHFNFAEYLSTLMGSTLAEIVEIPSGSWLGLWVFMLVAWLCNVLLDKTIQAVLVIILGYSLPAILRIIRGKLLKIKFDMCDHAELEKPFHSAEIEMELTDNSRYKFTEADELLRAQNSVKMDGTLQGSQFQRFLNIFTPNSYEPFNLIGRYGERSNYNHETHHHRWWHGENKAPAHAPEFTLELMRYCLLFNSIYVAVCFLIFFPAITKSASAGDISTHLAVAVLVIGIIPPIWTLSLAPLAVQEFVITSNLENMKNNRVIEQGVRRMKTRSAFLALKVIYMMASGSHKKEAQRNSIESRPEEKESEQSVTQTLKQKKVWHEIFKIMDEDDSDTLSQDELQTLLKKVLGSRITEAQIQDVIQALDKDGDDNISFEEFFKFANDISNNTDEQERAEEISDAIFDIIDQPDPAAPEEDGDAEISIKELESMCNDFKQELSPDDVFQVIKDIDEDGNGKLNKEEFFELLQRLDIVPTEKHE
uniref:EF-hand domain-containing protein n=1 Tax=Octactis speculum TaxID=3111310 RepID=A0A7S2BR70_9STRA